MLFVSESDLEFLTLFNRKLMENGIMRAIIVNNKHAFYEQNQTKSFHFSRNVTLLIPEINLNI